MMTRSLVSLLSILLVSGVPILGMVEEARSPWKRSRVGKAPRAHHPGPCGRFDLNLAITLALPQLFEDTAIFQGRGVARHFNTAGQVPQQAAHDFA